MKNKIKVLHVMYGLDSGGVESVIYNYYHCMDHTLFHFDVVAQSEKNRDNSKDLFAQKFREVGANVYYICPKGESLLRCMQQFMFLLRRNSYDIVHVHMGQGSLPYVIWARLCGVKGIIVHTHVAFDTSGWSVQPSTRIMGRLLCGIKTHRAACSAEAGRELWGEQDVFVLNNAIDLERYNIEDEIRSHYRKDLDLDGNTAICAVARFVESKNHAFLLEIFQHYLAFDNSAKLLLVGTGELQETLTQKVREMQLEARVIFLGVRKDIPELLRSMDLFVLPSAFEGFGMAYVEAQLAGLPTFAIEGAIPEAVRVSDSLFLIPREASAQEWAAYIYQNRHTCSNHNEAIRNARRRGFDIKREAEKLEQYYLKIIEE